MGQIQQLTTMVIYKKKNEWHLIHGNFPYCLSKKMSKVLGVMLTIQL